MMIYDDRTGGDDVFPEYDPTPYSGGYDQALAYGQPVTPSHETCYTPESMLDPSLNQENFTHGRGSSEDSPYQAERDMVDFNGNSGGGDVDRPRYLLDGEPWRDDPSHPYGYGDGYGYDYGDNWSCGWDWPKHPEEAEYGSRVHLDYAHPVSYADYLADWLQLHQEDSPHQSHLGEDYQGRQDTRHECMSEWKSAVEYIFGRQDSCEHGHADGAMPDYSFCDYQSYDRLPTANNYRLQGRSFSRFW
ncbi:uncharacterized protein At5g39570-like isoform X2 [Nymphaea colorata]|uniref:uncharacterized protein At5g39570-like isoform X2 n=1 Tax=Nymphaea colorata TaxID=210225 RepID=UPI00129E3E71|nr:uncharacterized protein At5g39570-like isoform X2 [Nymphaea colorata]